MDDTVMVLVTVGNEEEAVKIAQALVGDHIVACANIVPQIRSIYFWKGEVCDDKEVLVIFKTVAARFAALKERILQLHSYEVPEIISFSIREGNPAYLRWVVEETKQ